MPWFKVDDNLAFHQKVLRAGNSAIGLWVRAGSWCAQQLSDGYVPTDIARTMGTAAEAKKLVAANLWLEVDGGYQFWQWSEEGRQPTRAEVEEKRKATRERQRRAREKAQPVTASVTRDTTRDNARDLQRDNPVTDSVSHASPDPTRPDPTQEVLTLGGQRPETLQPAAATPPPEKPYDDERCSTHQGVADPPPCTGCKAARERTQRRRDRDEERDTERRRLELENARRDCPDCEGTGKVLDPDTKLPTTKRCTHPTTSRRTA